ncbi:DMT family transporter [Herbiconiux liangxiaofengii]|uniref:DMT family transporter n=1 Tax=Herbiconiux liangxiaofengii TaxID=3342795 RepID=UPI0035B7AC2D
MRRPGVVAAVSLVLATAFWAGNYVVGAVAVEQLDPVSLVLLRWGLAVVPLVVIAQLVERPHWRELLRHWPWLLAQAVTGLLGYTLLLYSALQFTDPLSASLVNAFNPALISLAAVLFLREQLSRTGVIGIVVALVGVLIVLSKGSVETLVSGGFGAGDLLMVGAILAWTVYTVLGRRAPRVPAISSTAVQAVIAVVLLLPVSLILGGPALPLNGDGWWALAFIAVFPSVLSYLLWNRALVVIPPARAGVFLNLITVFTALFAVLAGHPLSVPQLVGGVIVLGGVALANSAAFRRSPAAPAP